MCCRYRLNVYIRSEISNAKLQTVENKVELSESIKWINELSEVAKHREKYFMALKC